MSGHRSSYRYADGYAPSRASRSSYRPTTSYTTYTYADAPSSYAYYTTTDPYTQSSRARSPRRSSTSYVYTSGAYPTSGHTSSHTPYTSGGSHSHYDSTPGYSSSRTPYTSVPYTSRPRSPERPWTPVNTAPTRSRSHHHSDHHRSSRRHHRSRERREREREQQPSRLRRFLNNFNDALDSVPREDLHNFGTAAGEYLADRVGFTGVDGRTTDQRNNRDRYRGDTPVWGYSSMG